MDQLFAQRKPITFSLESESTFIFSRHPIVDNLFAQQNRETFSLESESTFTFSQHQIVDAENFYNLKTTIKLPEGKIALFFSGGES